MKKIYKKLVPLRSRLKLRQGLRRYSSFFYSGNNFYCNCCDRTFRKFLTKGHIPRPNAECPNCGSLERTRLLDLYLKNKIQLNEKSSWCILHIAPEACLKKKISSIADVTYIDGDINSAYADHIVDLTSVAFPDQHFDLIICSHVLGHIPDEATAIREMHRVLKPGGIALVMSLVKRNSQTTLEIPSVKTEPERLAAYGESDLCRQHGMNLQQRLEACGFSVMVKDYRTTFTEEDRERMRLGDGDRELIFHCHKHK